MYYVVRWLDLTLTEINATYWYLPVSLLFAAEQYFSSSAEQYFSLSLNSISPRPPRRRSPPIGYSAHWSAWGPLLGNLLSHCCLFKYIALCMCFVDAWCILFFVVVVCFRQFGWCMVYGIFTFHWILYILYDIVLLYCWKASCPIVVCWIMAWPPLSFTSSLKLWMFCWSCPLVYVVPLLLFFHCCCFSIVLDSLVRLEENSSSCWCKNQSSVLNIESVAGSYAEKSGCYAGEASCKVHAWNWNMCWNYSCCKDEARCG